METIDIRLRCPEKLHDEIHAHKPEYLPLTGFVMLLIEEGLTKFTSRSTLPAYRVGAVGNSTSPSEVCLTSSTGETTDSPTGEPAVSGSKEGCSSLGNSSIPESRCLKQAKKAKKKPEKPEYTPEFETFWTTYLGLPQRASKQSKQLAFAAYLVALDNQPHEALQRAVEAYARTQQEELLLESFTVCAPDCFRWLRDGCYEALLTEGAKVSDGLRRTSDGRVIW